MFAIFLLPVCVTEVLVGHGLNCIKVIFETKRCALNAGLLVEAILVEEEEEAAVLFALGKGLYLVLVQAILIETLVVGERVEHAEEKTDRC